MAYVIAEPCIGTEGQLVRRGLPGRLHPPDPGRARLRQGRDALHRPRGVHRLRRLRRGLPRGRLLRRGPAARRVAEVRADQRRVLHRAEVGLRRRPATRRRRSPREAAAGRQPRAREDQQQPDDGARARALAEHRDPERHGDDGRDVGDHRRTAGPDLGDQRWRRGRTPSRCRTGPAPRSTPAPRRTASAGAGERGERRRARRPRSPGSRP